MYDFVLYTWDQKLLFKGAHTGACLKGDYITDILTLIIAYNFAGCEASAPTLEAERRIVLVGRTGTGRSSSGNTLLGRSAFWVDISPRSVTMQCKRQSGVLDGQSISVVDTPGFFNTSLSLQEVMAEVGQCVVLSSPGPHAFLVTLQPGRFTQQERDSLEWIKATFGSGVTRFTIVLFTCGDQLQGKRIEDFLEDSDELSEFVSSCHGGYHVIDNSGQDRTTENSQQVVQLLEKIDKMVVDNGCGYYTKEMFEEADRAIREVKERIMGDKVQTMSPLRAVGDKNEQVHMEK
uniref:AIG1-type G domain-containing protein n=1 Tax=Sphaeramia orbicularis TaxID=375764 RepID=A0A672ZWX2_9TELE